MKTLEISQWYNNKADAQSRKGTFKTVGDFVVILLTLSHSLMGIAQHSQEEVTQFLVPCLKLEWAE